jgi:hypothetical protein
MTMMLKKENLELKTPNSTTPMPAHTLHASKIQLRIEQMCQRVYADDNTPPPTRASSHSAQPNQNSSHDNLAGFVTNYNLEYC